MNEKRIICVVTGTRAEFGLLKPVMEAIEEHPELLLRVLVTGTHLLAETQTVNEVAREFEIHGRIAMQEPGATSRLADAIALGRGISAMAEYFQRSPPDVVLVLGDRIEAFAAASCASVAGIRVAHMHGGDRAEGIADEAMRHAITKLSHIHFPATGQSAERLLCLGELALTVHLVGSPALDGLDEIPPLPDHDFGALGKPEIVFLLHPSGLSNEEEWANAERLLRVCKSYGTVLALHPNHDANREGILEAIEQSGCRSEKHLSRYQFVGLLRRIQCLVGNSSAGLIECAPLGVPVLNVGPRQSGREMPPNVLDIPDWDFGGVDLGLEEIMEGKTVPFDHPYGDGTAGKKTAEILANFSADQHSLTKHNTY